MVLRVAVTGGIGSGKSQVSRRLGTYGAVVIDSDVLARAAVARGSAGLERVVAEFGPEVLTTTGDLDRPALGRLVFGDPASRRRLEAIVHPEVRRLGRELERAAVAADPDVVVVHDVPLLVESRGRGEFDVVVVVDVPTQLQLLRLVRDRDMSETDAQARIDSQASRAERLAIADEIVENTGTLADLDRRVAELWTALQARHRSDSSGAPAADGANLR
jgi:dephospho-CoA kinase